MLTPFLLHGYYWRSVVIKYGAARKLHDDVIKWQNFPRYWPFVRGIHRSPVNSTHKGQWRGALIFSLIYAWINSGEADDLRRRRVHYNVTVMVICVDDTRRSLWVACNIESFTRQLALRSNERLYGDFPTGLQRGSDWSNPKPSFSKPINSNFN